MNLIKRPQKKQKKGSFTLLEVLIALTLMAVVISFASIQIKNLIAKQKFDQSLLAIKQKVLTNRMLAFELRQDMTLVFSKNSKGLHLFSYSEDRHIKNNKALEGIFSLALNGREIDALELGLYCNGQIYPSGMLTLYSEPNLQGKQAEVRLGI